MASAKDRIASRRALAGLGNISDTYISIAHTRGWGVGITSPKPVGVDMEFVRHDRPHAAALARAIATRAEEALVRDHCAHCVTTRIWTIKEAVRKAIASPAPRDAREFTIECYENSWYHVRGDKRVWYVKSHALADARIARAHEDAKTPFRWNITQMIAMYRL